MSQQFYNAGSTAGNGAGDGAHTPTGLAEFRDKLQKLGARISDVSLLGRDEIAAELTSAFEELRSTEEELRRQSDALAAANHRAQLERQRYQDLFENAPTAYLITRGNGTILEASAEACKLLGASREILCGKSFFNSVMRDDRDTARTLLLHASQNAHAEAIEFRIRARGAETDIYVSASSSRIPDTDISANQYRWILRDVSDRIREQQRVEEMNVELEERVVERTHELEQASRAKDDFLAMLSHELRTPLSAILLWSKVLRDGPSTPDELAEGLDAIVSSAASQARLIDDLLDTSRIAAGKLNIELKPTDLVHVVRSAVDAIRSTATAKRVTVEASYDPLVGQVLADAERLRQVTWNVLSNALKFSSAGGRITVDVKRGEGDVHIIVTDTGSGIPADFLPFVFDRFRQYEGPITRRTGGLGLGLAISKQLVELHGGSIRAESAGEGKGATIAITLPLAPAPLSAEAPRSSSSSAAAGPALPLSGMSVLLVEDDALSRDALSSILRTAGAQVATAESAHAALDTFGRNRPGIVVSDIGLPDGDGYQLISTIRRAETTAHSTPVPAIALSAYAREEDRARAIEAGFHFHLAKPVDTQKLIATIATMIGAVH